MELQYEQTVPLKANIPDGQILLAAAKLVRRKAGIECSWIENGQLYHEEHTSHSYDVCDGKATPEQVEADKISRHLTELAKQI